MTILVSRKAAIIAMLASLPFVGTASYLCIKAYIETRWPVDAIVYWTIGNMIFYVFGFPLTTIYALLMPYIGSFLMTTIGHNLYFLVIPTYVVLFEIQWVIWSQVIVRIRRRKKPRTGNG